jgi:deoxyribodipyrimidine photo-lyase
MSRPTVIHWFRRDLRLTDNTALRRAAQPGRRVIPVYVLSTWKRSHDWTGSPRQQFLCGCIESLAKNIESNGSRLIIRAGRAETELERLIKDTGAEAVYFNRDYDPFGRATEAKVKQMCVRLGVVCHDYKDSVMHEPGEVLTGEGKPYRVFTPFGKNWLSLPKTEPLGAIKSFGAPPDAVLASLPLPTLDHWKLPPCTAKIPAAGERAARERMKHFIEAGILEGYDQQRNTPAGRTTSRLSQDLRFGLISIRELVARCLAAKVARGPAETYVKELAWREFYISILWNYPEVFETEFSADFRGMPWDGSDGAFERWCEGRTGFPIVDAGMRELLGSGFMHNRVRMIVSMFLTKDLHCDWRLGESFFMQHLVDGENASNNGGWQWSAGTGADAAPYFRIQNPWTQTKRYDPLGEYIRTWVPELKNVPPDKLFEPPADGMPIAPGYPLPMVDHATERDRCLARFARHREQRA